MVAPQPPVAGHQRQKRLIIAVLLALATFAVYARVLSSDFTYLDDRTYVTENATVQKGLTWEGVRWAFTTVHGSNWHPLTWLSHMLDCSFFRLDPGGHHFTSLLLHVINAALLFHLLCRMTGALWASAFVAGAFALHPAHVESVAWVAERKDVLSTCFGLLSMIAYVRYAKAVAPHPHPYPSPLEGEGSQGKVRAYLLVVALYALSLMAKPMLVTLPFVLLLLDYWPLRRERSWLQLLYEKLPLLVLAWASSTVTMYAQRAGGAMMTQAMLPVEARVSNAIFSYAKYLWMTLWPSGLAVYYPHPLKAHPVGVVAAATLVLLVITAAVVALRRKHPYLLLGWLWFLGTLVPVIGLVQVGGQAMADRYSYVPIIGLFIMVAWGVSNRHEGTEARRHEGKFDGSAYRRNMLSPGAAGAVILIVLGMATFRQAGYWRDSMTLFQRALEVVPENPQAHIFMANTLIRQGRVDAAVTHFAEAVRIVPNEPYNLTDYGHALLENGKIDEAAARLEEALALLPDFADAHGFLGIARVRQGRMADAVKHLDFALSSDSKWLVAHLHLGIAYAAQNKWALAITHLQKWLEVDPRSIDALTKLAQCYYSLGNEAAARDTLQKAVQAHPKNPYPLALMGQMETWSGKFESAIALYEQAMQIDPRYAEAANNLALILATHPDDRFRDGEKAVQLAEIAAGARQYQDPVSLDTLAAAYAEVGRFADATRTIESAIELVRNSGAAPFIEQLEQRRALYAAGKPARAE